MINIGLLLTNPIVNRNTSVEKNDIYIPFHAERGLRINNEPFSNFHDIFSSGEAFLCRLLLWDGWWDKNMEYMRVYSTHLLTCE